MGRYADRRQAGRVLASALAGHAGRRDTLTLGLPRGGVPVAYEVARRLGSPLDVFVVRKLGVPGHEELAMGAVAAGGVVILNESVVQYLRIPDADIEAAAAGELGELARQERAYRDDRPPVDAAGKTVFLVDDGLATGATMRAAIAGLRRLGPARVVVAVPIAAPTACEELRTDADEVVCAATPEPFYSVGQWYVDFSQTTDEEVRTLLAEAEAHAEAARQAETVPQAAA